MATLSISSYTKNSITLTLTGVNEDTSGQRACSWKIGRSSGNYGTPEWTYLDAGVTQTTKTFSSLYAGTTYYIQASYQKTSGSGYTTLSEKNVTTTAPSGTLTISNITQTSATVSISNFNPYDNGETKKTCYAYLWFGTGNTATDRESGANNVTIASSNIPYSGGSYNKTGLTANTTYTFEYRIQPDVDDTNKPTWKINKTFTTTGPTGSVIVNNITTTSADVYIQNLDVGENCWGTFYRKTGTGTGGTWTADSSGNLGGTIYASNMPYTTAVKTISGLSPSTTYTFKYNIYSSSTQNLLYTPTKSFTTATAPATSVGVTCYNITSTSVTVKITGASSLNGYKCFWRKRKSNESYGQAENINNPIELDGSDEGGVYTFSNLTPSTTYYFQASVAISASASAQATGESYCTTSASSARIIICGFTTSSITLRVIDATAGTWKWYWRLNGGTYAQYDATTVASNGGKSAAITKSNLSFGGTGNLISYDFKVVYDGLSTAADEITNITCAPSSGDFVRNFTHQTWNLMVDSVNAYRGPANWETTTGYTLTAAQTRMPNSPPYTLTAARFNQLWYNLQQLRTGMANDFPVATNSSTSGAGSEYHVFAYRFYDASEWCLNDGLEKMQSG